MSESRKMAVTPPWRIPMGLRKMGRRGIRATDHSPSCQRSMGKSCMKLSMSPPAKPSRARWRSSRWIASGPSAGGASPGGAEGLGGLTSWLIDSLFLNRPLEGRLLDRGGGPHQLPGGGVPPRRVPEEPPRHLHRSEEHTSELQSRENLVCRLLLEKKN